MSLHSAWLLLSLVSTTANKEGRDLSTLFASVGPRLHFSAREALALGELRVPPAECEPLGDGQLDCTEPLRRELSRQPGYETIVLLKPLIIREPGTTCSLIEMRSIMRRAVWENKNFSGIGFFADGVLSFVEKSQLLVQKDVYLLSNNEPAIVHSFIDVGLCTGESDHYDFKGFAQFNGPDEGTLTRVWENQPQNYHLTSGQRGFDRTLDVIRP